MPTYQYTCTDCQDQLEVVQKFTDDPLVECPSCEGTLRKVFSAVGVVFKGSGFYRTDSRNDNNGRSSNGSDHNGATESATKSDSADSASTGSSDSTSSDSASSSSSSGSADSSGSTGTSSSGGSAGSGNKIESAA